MSAIGRSAYGGKEAVEMKFKSIFLGMGLLMVLCSISLAQVPQMINYQGKLTTSAGAPVNGTLQMVFTIYADSNGTTPLWAETQPTVVVDKGVFNVLLGSVDSIPYSVFDGSIRYLGVKVGGDPEITPRKPMVSVAYAMRAGGSQLDCHDCDTVFVNVAGPDSVKVTSGTAFRGVAVGSSIDPCMGIWGEAKNSSSGPAYGGIFVSSDTGTGNHYGIRAAAGSSSDARAYGVYGSAFNSSSGEAVGGFFEGSCDVEETGPVTGVHGDAYGRTSSGTFGCVGTSSNNSSGEAFGGYFVASSHGSGEGDHFGVRGGASQSTSASAAYGFYGIAIHEGTGPAYGGYFSTTENGTGPHYGVSGLVNGSSSAASFGCYGLAYNTSASGSVHGCYGFSSNTTTGIVYGGYFEADTAGTGTKYGIYAKAPTNEGWSGYFQGDVRITDSLVVLGGKSAAVKVDNGEYRLLYSQESPEVWFEDFGEGQLTHGKAIIELDPLFTQTVNTQVTYHVFLTPGGDCNGLYVVDKTPASFEVRELKGGNSNLTFSYRIVAKRKGYENIRLSKMGKPTPEEVALEQAKNQAEREEQRQEMKKERGKIEQDRLRQEGMNNR
jgi:hypothetical protein